MVLATEHLPRPGGSQSQQDVGREGERDSQRGRGNAGHRQAFRQIARAEPESYRAQGVAYDRLFQFGAALLRALLGVDDCFFHPFVGLEGGGLRNAHGGEGEGSYQCDRSFATSRPSRSKDLPSRKVSYARWKPLEAAGMTELPITFRR